AAFGEYDDAELRTRFEALRWDEPPAFEQWTREVAEARSKGFAVDDGNYIAGAAVVSAPVWKAPGKPSHALVATIIGGGERRARLDELSRALVDGAQMLTAQLGGSATP